MIRLRLERTPKSVEKAKMRSKALATKLPGEFLHRGASFVIICEAVFHTFHKMLPIVVAGIVFVAYEILVGAEEEF